MKNKITYKFKGVILALILFWGSCTNLDENPVGLLAPESFFKTEADVEAAVMGVYSYFASESLYGRQYTTAVALLGDICDIGDIGTQAARIAMNNLNVDGNNGMLTSFWQNFYAAIGAANSAINGVGIINISEQKKADELLAEARILRAHCYYQLVRLFGDVPYVGEFVTDPAKVKNMSRTPQSEVYQHIIEDCEYAIEHLPDNYTNNIRCRPSKGSAKTMLADVYLTLGNYQEAARYAEEVINERAKYGYGLMDDFKDLWIADKGDTKEHIWTVDFLAGNIRFDDLWGPMTGARNTDMQGWSVVVPSPGFYAMYDQGDSRIETTFVTETLVKGVMTPYTKWTWPRIHFGKYCLYPGKNSNSEGRYSGRNYPIYRFAEVYLIAAEALTEVNKGPTPKALEYINEVKKRARKGGSVPADINSGLDKAQFIDVVLKERMLELAAEYKRWFDIKRRDLGDEVFKGPNSIEPHSTLNSVKQYLLPIPQAELDRNPNLLPQNAGY